MDLPAETIALLYRYRWTIELFFRWFKCVLRFQHLIFESREGVEIIVYCALIASLLITLWTGRKPTKRTLEMVQLYSQGWAELDELEDHIARPSDTTDRTGALWACSPGRGKSVHIDHLCPSASHFHNRSAHRIPHFLSLAVTPPSSLQLSCRTVLGQGALCTTGALKKRWEAVSLSLPSRYMVPETGVEPA